MKNSLEGIQSRSEPTETRRSKLEDRPIEITQPEDWIRTKKLEQSLGEMANTIIHPIMHVKGLPERQERKNQKKMK